LLFCLYAKPGLKGSNNGLFKFTRMKDGWIESENRFVLCDGSETYHGEVTAMFRFSAKGIAWIQEVSLVECPPVPRRPARVTCVRGKVGLERWEQVIDAAAKEESDLVLLPETITGEIFCRWSRSLRAGKFTAGDRECSVGAQLLLAHAVPATREGDIHERVAERSEPAGFSDNICGDCRA